MTLYITIAAVSVLLFIAFFIGKKVGFGVVFEKLAFIWFKLACSFAFLYIVHIIVDGYDIIVPVNIFSALTITILGIPGILCIAVLTITQ